jgi:hypothetical protein
MGYTFKSVSKSNPCTCCGKTDYCTRAEDIDSDAKIGGRKLIEAFKCMRANGQKLDGYIKKNAPTKDGGNIYLKLEDGESKIQRPKQKAIVDFSVSPVQRPKLSVQERDKNYRYLKERFGDISTLAKMDLTGRGLSDDEIKFMASQGWISNWVTNERMPLVNINLPGVDRETGKTIGGDGLAIAAMTPENKIQGYQIYPKQVMYLRKNGLPLEKTMPNGEVEKIAKYRWLSSSQGNSVQVNKEMPLTVWKHPDMEPKAAVYCEGFLKSAIAAIKIWREGYTDIVVIGAASGRYQEGALKKTLEALPGIDRHILAPDADSHTNEHVLMAYADFAAKMESMGKILEVAYVGGKESIEKHIDELSSIDYQEMFSSISNLPGRDPVIDLGVKTEIVGNMFNLKVEGTEI